MSAVPKEVFSLGKPAANFIGTPRQLLIDGKWVNAESGKTFQVINPATGEQVGKVAEADKADVDKAVKAARKAFESGAWPSMTKSDRGKLLHRVGDLILKYADELAELESLDNGKPVVIARHADVALAADIFHYMSGWATKRHGLTIPFDCMYTPGVQ